MLIYRKSAFTLIELLVVMVVSLLLAGLALPAFNRLVQGNSVDRAASGLQIQLKQAQFNAISSRRETALLFDLSGTDSGVGPAVRLCYVKGNKSNGIFNFVRYAESSNWVPISSGAVVALARLDDPDNMPAMNGTPNISLYSVKSISPAWTLPAIVFNRYGAVAGQMKTPRIIVAEGTMENAKIVYTGTRDSDNKPENFIKISVNPFSGKPTLIFPGE